MGKALYIQSVAPEIYREFSEQVTRCFGQNLHFAFIFGGMAKGYATNLEHDIDMFVCLKHRDDRQEGEFLKFYFATHDKYRFKADPKDLVEFATYEEIEGVIHYLDDLFIAKVMETYQSYESVVWGDIFSGKVEAKTGDLVLLANLQSRCAKYPEKWRKDILSFLTEPDFLQEGRLVLERNSLIQIIQQNFSQEQIEDEGGLENLRNFDLCCLRKISGNPDYKKQDSNIKDCDLIKIGKDVLQYKPVTLMFEKYVTYLQKTKPCTELYSVQTALYGAASTPAI